MKQWYFPTGTYRVQYQSLPRVRDRAWFVRLYGEIIPSFSEGIIDCTGAQTMLCLTCTMIFSVDLAHYGVSRAKDSVYVDCGTPFVKALLTIRISNMKKKTIIENL